MKTHRIPAVALLAAGFLLTIATGPRWGAAALAWIAPVPFLVFARRAQTWRAWLALLGVLLAGYCAWFVGIVTPPVPLLAVLGFGPPIALLRFGAIGAGELVRRRLGEGAGIAAYVAATVVLDWVGYGVTPFGAWVATANSQVEALGVLQLAAIAGLAAIGALMAWTAATAALWVAGAGDAYRRQTVALAATLVVVLVWGAWRLDRPVPGRGVMVATVVTTVGPGADGLPDAAALAANNDDLFARTEVAAARGARLVVWNEIATLVDPPAEAAFVERGRELARRHGIDLVLAYGVLERRDPWLFDNKYVFISDTGEILDEYQKHHPVPGEPSIRGTGPLKVLDRPYGKVGGAICYDYDFPAMAREHARGGAELVVVPSSDWRGIDPVHTFMARVRAIEGGFSMVRAARWSASGAFDAHGRVRAWGPAIDETDGIMLARVPVGRIDTLAAQVGDAPVALAGVVLAGFAAGIVLRRRRAPAAVVALGLTSMLAACSGDFSDLVPPTVDEDATLPAADLDGTRVHFETFGTPGAPVVIALHGGPGHDHRSLRPLAALGDAGYFVVLWDQRGTGLSRRHDCDELTADAYLGDLEALVDRYAPVGGPPLFLVGHSWGAMYATWFIHEHPDRVRAAVLVEPGGFTRADVAAYFQRLFTSAPLSEAIGDGLWAGRLLTPDDHARADLMSAIMYDAVREPLGMSARDPMPAWRGGGVVASCMPPTAGDFDWTPGLDRYPGEVLFLHGDRNQVLTTEQQESLAAHFGRVEVQTFAGAGHDLHWVERDRFVAMTRAHLDAQLEDGETP